jgi:hypothetical protein
VAVGLQLLMQQGVVQHRHKCKICSTHHSCKAEDSKEAVSMAAASSGLSTDTCSKVLCGLNYSVR